MATWNIRSRPAAWAGGDNSHAFASGDRRTSSSAVLGLGVHFECTTAGTSAGSEPTWDYTVGNTTTSNTAVFTCRGGGANVWVTLTAYALGDRVIATTSATADRQACIRECTTAGTTGVSEPTWTVTNGNTDSDGTVVWTCRRAQSWANAHSDLAKLAAATTAANKPAAGDDVYISKTHTQTTAAAVTISLLGTQASPQRLIGVDDTGDPSSPTTVATGATFLAATNASTTFTINGCFYAYGLTVKNGASANANGILSLGTIGDRQLWDTCTFRNLTQAGGASAAYSIGSASNTSSGGIIWRGCTFSMDLATISILQNGGEFHMEGCTLTAPVAAPTNLFTPQPQRVAKCTVSNTDLSPITGNLVLVTSLANNDFTFRYCKLGAAVTLTSGTWTGLGTRVRMHNCDSGNTNYRMQEADVSGTASSETTIVRSSGASDGTTALSWKLVSTSSSKYPLLPFVSPEFVIWNTVTGSRTVTVEYVHDKNVAGGQGAGTSNVFQNDEVWLEVMELGTSSFPLGVWNTSSKIVLATAADNATSSATWTTTGLTTPQKAKLTATFTVQSVGPIVARVCIGKASKTIYVDPLITLS